MDWFDRFVQRVLSLATCIVAAILGVQVFQDPRYPYSGWIVTAMILVSIGSALDALRKDK